MRTVKNLHKRSEKVGLSLFKYVTAFLHGYEHKGTRNKSPFCQEKEPKRHRAYMEGRELGMITVVFLGEKKMTKSA